MWGAPFIPSSDASRPSSSQVPDFPTVLSTQSARWVRWSDAPGTLILTGYAGAESGLAGRLLSGLGTRLGWGWEGDLSPLMSHAHTWEPWVVGVEASGIWTMGLKDPSELVLSRFFFARGDGHWHVEDWVIQAAHGREMVYGWKEGDRVYWLERAVSQEGGAGYSHLRWASRTALDQIEEGGIWMGALPSEPSAYWNLEDYLVWADAGEGLVWLSKKDLSVATASAKSWREELLLMGRESGWIWNQGNTLFRGNDSTAIQLELGELAGELTFAPLRSTRWPLPGGKVGPWGLWGWGLFLSVALLWGIREWRWRLRLAVPTGSRLVSDPENGEAPPAVDAQWKERVVKRVDDHGLSSISHWSPMLRLILVQEKRVFTTAEFDVLLGIDDINSPETLRARRSRIIQTVNGEFNLLYGMDLILRDREQEDRRKSLYRIAHLPPALQKYLHKHGLSGAHPAPHILSQLKEEVAQSTDWKD